MKRSTHRILTTHVGSLIRPPELLKFIAAKQGGVAYDQKAYAACLGSSVSEIVERQKEAGIEEGFLPVAAPSSVIPDRRNEYYKSDEDCLHAIADAMRTEYKAIVDAGLLLQLDDARAAVTYDRMVPPGTLQDYRKWVALHA